MYFINSLRHKELTEILTKISFPEKSGSNSLKPEAVSCNLLSLCVLAPVFFTPRKLAEVSREIIVASAQEIAWTPGSSRIDGKQCVHQFAVAAVGVITHQVRRFRKNGTS
ncbi:hypothetical protein ELE63_30265 [Klebsiella pneumoniae]|nr:hypothetical protein [Klebsiella pneumoniae]